MIKTYLIHFFEFCKTTKATKRKDDVMMMHELKLTSKSNLGKTPGCYSFTLCRVCTLYPHHPEDSSCGQHPAIQGVCHDGLPIIAFHLFILV